MALPPFNNTPALCEDVCLRQPFKNLVYPTKQQQSLLEQQLEECRWLQNHLLAERREAWEQRHASVRLDDQQATVPVLQAERLSLASVSSHVVQHVAVRIDRAFHAFVRRCASGETPG